MKLPPVLILYVAFAIVATGVNLATQRMVLILGPGAGVFVLGRGEAWNEIVLEEYLLDRRWIFRDQGRGAAHHGRTFLKYSLMGLATTALFWITETLFWLSWGTETAREIGAILGLAVGYAVKYQLDRHFVFARPTAEAGR